MSDKYLDKYRIPSTRLQNWNYSWNGKYFITICTRKMQHYFGEIVNQKMILSHVGVLADVFWHEIKNHAKNVELDAFVVMPNHVHGILILNNPFDYSSIPDHSKKEIKIEKLADDDPMKGILKEVDENYWEYLKATGGKNLRDNEKTPNSAANPNPDFHTNNPAKMGSENDLIMNPNDFFEMDPNDNPNMDAHDNMDTHDNPNMDTHDSTDNACDASTPNPTPHPESTDNACVVSTPNPTPGSQRFQNQGKNSISSIIGSYKSAVSKHAHRLGYEMGWHPRFWDHIIRNDEELKRIRHYINNNPQNWGKDKFRRKGGSIHGK